MLLLFCNFTTVATEDVVLVPAIVKVSRAISLKPPNTAILHSHACRMHASMAKPCSLPRAEALNTLGTLSNGECAPHLVCDDDAPSLLLVQYHKIHKRKASEKLYWKADQVQDGKEKAHYFLLY